MDTSGVNLVFGAGGGIGRAICQALVHHGARSLVLADLNLEAAETTANLLKKVTADCTIDSLHLDVRKQDSIEAVVNATVEKFARIDVFVNAAGIGAKEVKPVSLTQLSDYEDLDRTHNLGTFMSLTAVLNVMRRQTPREIPIAGLADHAAGTSLSRGTIVILTSLASEGAYLGAVSYIAAKHAQKALVGNAALENARKGIRVNAVAPSYVSGPMMDALLEAAPAIKKDMLADLPIGRLGDPREVAETVAYLASPSSSYVNGHTLVHDGGASKALARGDYEGF